MSHWPKGNIISVVVTWDDHERGVSGIAWRVGVDGVTLIEATEKNAEYCSIPYVRVWRGDAVVAEYCQHGLREVRFAPLLKDGR